MWILVSQLIGSVAVAFVVLTFLWMLKHRRNYSNASLIIGGIIAIFQTFHFLIHCDVIHNMLSSQIVDQLECLNDVGSRSLFTIIHYGVDDVTMMVLSFLNARYHSKARYI